MNKAIGQGIETVARELLHAPAPEVGGALTDSAMSSGRLLQDSYKLTFKEPLKLVDALERLKEIRFRPGALRFFNISDSSMHLGKFVEEFKAHNPLPDVRASALIGTGAHILSLATDTQSALKLSIRTQVRRPTPHPYFDADVLDYGRVGKNVRYYMQPIGSSAGVNDDHVLDVIRNIRSNGFVERDMFGWDGDPRHSQIALFGDSKRPLLIDQDAARPLYGSEYKAGELVPHPEQLRNIAAMREFIDKAGIRLTARPSSVLRPPPALTEEMPETKLVLMVKDHMMKSGQQPTFKAKWTEPEVYAALDALTDRA